MSKIKRPKLNDYLKQSKGQGLGSLINQGVSQVTNVDTTRVITNQSVELNPQEVELKNGTNF